MNERIPRGAVVIVGWVVLLGLVGYGVVSSQKSAESTTKSTHASVRSVRESTKIRVLYALHRHELIDIDDIDGSEVWPRVNDELKRVGGLTESEAYNILAWTDSRNFPYRIADILDEIDY